jgi:cytochrome P450
MLAREQILGEILQILYAGHLTVPYVLMNFWREIVTNGLVSRIASEADQLCAGGAPEMAAISRSYCFAAVKECMRLHAPAPILYREAERTFELGGFEFAQDASVWVSPHLLHTDDRYFAKPDRFIPERFMGRDLPPTSRRTYLPFGVGHRKCIGHLFALHQVTSSRFTKYL